MKNTATLNAIKDEDSCHGRLIPFKAERFNRQINICVSERTFKLYRTLRSDTSSYVTERLRLLVMRELERINKEINP